jgi:hypothetical protein
VTGVVKGYGLGVQMVSLSPFGSRLDELIEQ